VVTILHDRTEELEKERLYEQLKLASAELEHKVQQATGELANQNELLRRQALQLEQASALKSQFLANVSHEFRTPLNAILGYTQMLLKGTFGSVEPGQQRGLERVESNGRHLLALINDVLDISRIEAGRMPLTITRFKLPQLIAEVLAELEPIIARSKLVVTQELVPSLPEITSDRQKVKQIIVNLLSNALKFTPQGSVKISARANTRGKAVSVAVADTGIGISKAQQAKVFEDFSQIDTARSRVHGGTGLGLAICRRLAQLLDGTLTLESAAGAGSTFTLVLPTALRKRR
jgi:signal transduction histidine kinase